MPTIGRVDRILFRWMLREEWRLHASLFGGRRFAAFPLVVALVTAAAVFALVETGTSLSAVIAGLHALVFAFGLHTGSIGLVGRDAIDDVLGELTLLVFSARTLPLSRRRLLAHFLVKDAVYYSGLFLVPITLAFLAAVGRDGFTPASVALLWVSTTATFLVGLAITLGVVGLAMKGIVGWVSAGAVGTGVIALWYLGVDVLAATPYALYRSPSVLAVAGTIATVAVATATGLYAFEPVESSPTRTVEPALERWRSRLRDESGITAKTVLDVARSSGGLWKVVFSGGILFVVSTGLIELAERITGVAPSVGVTFGILLGLSAFTTYNWVTMYDDPESYLYYPIGVSDLFVAKRYALVLIGLPTALAYFGLAAVLFDAEFLDSVAGLFLLVGVHQYLFGLTTALAGFHPNEFLFDTLLFALFTAAVALVLVPALIVALVVTPLSGTTIAALGAGGVALLVVGEVLFRFAVARWSDRLTG